MATVMKASVFVEKLKDIAKNYKTLYVMGSFGSPLNATQKKRLIAHNSYNAQASRIKHINAASADTFGFDCVCLIKGILWGWKGDKTKAYGGAKYLSNGVPDVTANGMINLCKDVTTDFSKIEVGEAVWSTGHIGVYIGDGLAVECTPAWKNKVQITAVGNIGSKSGYNSRKWTKHGKLPYIEYDVKPAAKPAEKTSTVKVDVATKYDKKLTGAYKVTAAKLHIRAGANPNKTSLGILPKGTVVQNYGYYSVNTTGVKWYYVVAPDGTIGFCSSWYLKKC